jgi:hypothetical protein
VKVVLQKDPAVDVVWLPRIVVGLAVSSFMIFAGAHGEIFFLPTYNVANLRGRALFQQI